LTINSSGQISGTPPTPGIYFPRIALTDLVTSEATTFSFTLIVDPFAITTAGVLPQATVGVAYSQQLEAPGCGTGCAWSVGLLPGGLALTGAGLLQGTPASSTSTFFTVQASGSGGTVQKVFSLSIANTTLQPLAINNSGSVLTTVGGLANVALLASGGVPPYTWALGAGQTLPPGVSLQTPGELFASFFAPGFSYLSGRGMQVGVYTLPPGLRVMSGSNGVQNYLGGVPTTPGVYSSQMMVSDSGTQTLSVNLTIRVSALALTPDSLPPGWSESRTRCRSCRLVEALRTRSRRQPRLTCPRACP
jgi:hypothetical protein